MFELTLVDHLRLAFAHVVQRHAAHVQIARARTRWSIWLRTLLAMLVMGAAVTSLGGAFGHGYGYSIASAVFASLALLVLLIQISWNLDASAHAHASCATALALLGERYRAVLSDLTDGAIDPVAARARRDALMLDLNTVYDNPMWSGSEAWRTASQIEVTEETLSDEQIDRLLPRSLQKVHRPATT
jgi:uncharacterized membrane protein